MFIYFSDLFGRVFAVRRRRPPNPENPTIRTLVSHSLSRPMLTISSKHIAASGQDPDLTMGARIPEDDSSDDDAPGRVLQEHTRTTLTMIAPVFGAIPVAGPPLKSAACSLLAILDAVDVGLFIFFANI